MFLGTEGEDSFPRDARDEGVRSLRDSFPRVSEPQTSESKEAAGQLRGVGLESFAVSTVKF